MERAGHSESSPHFSLWLWVPDLRFACPGRQRREDRHSRLSRLGSSYPHSLPNARFNSTFAFSSRSRCVFGKVLPARLM